MKKIRNKTAKAGLLAMSVFLAVPNGDGLNAQVNLQSGVQSGSSKIGGVKMGNEKTEKMFLKFSEKFMKWKGDVAIAGMEAGNPVYKNTRNEYFTLDPNTGDMKMIGSDIFIKFNYIKGAARSSNKLSHIKFDGIKGEAKVSILGVDKQGNIIQQNSKGEKFYLDQYTGDMVFTK